MCSKDKTSRQSLHYGLDIDDIEQMEKEMMKPFLFHTADKGHKARRNMLKLLGHWLGVPEDKMKIVDELIHYIYNGTILLDDMQDGTILRRGKPTAPTVFGITRTVLAFDWSTILCLQILVDLDNDEVNRTLVNALPKLLGGQGLELYWRDNNICPTEVEYLEMAHLKVSEAFLLLGKVMTIFSTNKNLKLEKLLSTFGIYFQVYDDYRNLRDQSYFEFKGFCEDFTEGKFSYPVVHCIKNFPQEGQIIQNILKKKTYDVEEKKRCLDILEECGSFEYTEKAMEDLKEVIFKEIEQFDDNPELKMFLETAILAYL